MCGLKQACLEGMQCSKIGMQPSSVPTNEMYDVGPQYGGAGSSVPVTYSPPLFTQERWNADSLIKSPLMTAHLRLLDAGVPAVFLWDESDRKMANVVYFTTPETAQSAEAEIKALTSSQDYGLLQHLRPVFFLGILLGSCWFLHH